MRTTGRRAVSTLQVDWRFDLGPGQLGVDWLVSWLDSFTTAAEDSVGSVR